MKINTKKVMMGLVLPVATLLLAGCDANETIDEIIDDSDKSRSAVVNYINSADTAMDFHIKSPIYNSDIYQDKHLVTAVLAGEVSIGLLHSWVDYSDTEQSKFAMTDSNSKTIKVDTQFELADKKEYWSIGWLDNATYQQTTFLKQQNNEQSKYSIRVFANTAYSLQRIGENAELPATEAGVISDSFIIDECNDLYVDGKQIDICSMVEVSSSYLLVVNKDGLVVAVKE
ncbi:MAG: hypothetical protein GY951_13925 [Psychromonas sp.]|nr:hypothetical protein [Psychromonas sp.]